MLILTRKKDEQIVIGNNIFVMIVDVVGGRVKLGIDAPADVQVHRREIFDLTQGMGKDEQEQ